MAWTNVVLPAPKSPEDPRTARACSARPPASPHRLSSSAGSRTAPAIPFGLEVQDLIAQQRGRFKVELLRRGLHLRFQEGDEGLPLLRVRGLAGGARLGPAHTGVGHARDE